MLKKYPLIIMAGSDTERTDALLDYADVDYKALITLNGKTLLELILEAMQESGVITYTYIIGISENKINLPEHILTEKISFLEIPDEKVPERLDIAARHMIEEAKKNPDIFPGGTFHGLFISGDTPFIQPNMIRDFVEEIGVPEYDLYPSMVNQTVMEKRFPKSNRTYGRLVEGRYCMGDIILLDLSLVSDRLPQVRILRKNRKKFVTTIFKFAPMTAVRFVLRRLSIKNLEDGAGKVFKVKCKFIDVPHAELAMDIDKPAQLDMAQEEFQK